MQDPGRLGDAEAAQPEGARTGVTRRSRQPAPKERGCGATCKLDPEAKPEGADAGQPADPTGRRCGRSKAAGRLAGSLHQAALKDARVGATRSSIAGTAGRCGSRGNPEPHRETALEERVCGVTRGSAPRNRRRMREPGQLGAPSPARSEDAGLGGTRSLIDRRDWHSEFAGQPGES
jgi:hypothetical protein